MLKKILIFLISLGLIFTAVSCASQTKLRPSTETAQVEVAGGIIPVVIQKPAMQENDKVPLVVVMHGFMASKEYPLVTNLADKLQAAGFAVVRFDFNGHGEGYGRFEDMTVLSEVEDAKAVIEFARALPYTKNINLAGHSQGGVVTSIVAGELTGEINSIVLFAPAAVLEEQSKAGMVMGNVFDPENIPEIVEVFGHRLGRAYIQQAQTLDIYGRASSYKGPACIIHGTDDMVVPHLYGEKYHDLYQESELYLLDGENHGFEVDTDMAAHIAVEYLLKENFR